MYVSAVVKDAALDAPLLRALLERGVPQAFAPRLDPKQLDLASKSYLVRALLERGRRYFRAQDFADGARMSAQSQPSPEQALYHALASTLQNGPRDASDLLLGGPVLPAGTGQVGELDRLASEKSNPSAPLAAFDAAYLQSLVPPPNDPKFWDDLSKRFNLAERGLHDPDQKKRAHDAGAAAKDTEKALLSAVKPTAPPKKSAK